MDNPVIETARMLSSLTEITARCYKNDKIVAYYSSGINLGEINDSFRPYIKEIDDYPSPVGCITTKSNFIFGFVRHDDMVLVLGPVKNGESTREEVEGIADWLDPSGVKKEAVIQTLMNCPRMSQYSLIPLLAYAYRLFDFSARKQGDLLPDVFLSSMIYITFYDSTIAGMTSRHFSMEYLFEKIIEEGNISAMEEWYSSNPLLHFNIPISDDERRNAIDCFIIMTTLYARAAAHGGLDRRYTFQLQLDAIRTAEKTDKIEDILMLQTNLARQYVKEVAQLKETSHYSKLVRDAIQIINRDKYSNIKTEEIAKELFVSRGYLSKAFHRETGEKLNDYIMKVKIHEAKKLLLHTEGSLQSISSTLGFSTQSYFTKIFKEATDMTPRQYRLSATEQ